MEERAGEVTGPAEVDATGGVKGEVADQPRRESEAAEGGGEGGVHSAVGVEADETRGRAKEPARRILPSGWRAMAVMLLPGV